MSIRTVGGVLWGFIYENTIKHEKIFKFPRKYLLLYNRTEFTAICRMTIMSDAMTHYGHPLSRGRKVFRPTTAAVEGGINT